MEWCREGKLHRDDGPAVVRADGTKEWYRDGQRPSEDGPAVMQANGTRMWYRDGKLHRDDGPAIEWANGMNRWYVDGERVDKNVPHRLPRTSARNGISMENVSVRARTSPSPVQANG
jgi:hypothetical protein